MRFRAIPILIFLLFSSTLIPSAFPETKVFIEEYTYQASEVDSKVSSRVIALEQVKRLLFERLGTYLESETEVKNFQLTKDQILTLTAGVVRSQIIDERWDGKAYYLKAKITVDPNEVANSIDMLRQDRQKAKEMEETRKKADDALREVERLKKELEIAKAGKILQGQYNKAVNSLSSTDWIWRGIALGNLEMNQEAKDAFDKAIELDPNDAVAYNNRAVVYSRLGDQRQAIRDYNRAINLNPELSIAYAGRAATYGKIGDYRQAIKDSEKSIDLDPTNSVAYSNRALAYVEVGNYQQAIVDINRAIELNPKHAMSFLNRGYIYGKLGDDRQAIEDYSKAIEINPKFAMAYNNCGVLLDKLGDQQQAIGDFDKAIDLNLKYAEAYLNRGRAFIRIGNHQQGIEDLKNAARLGNKWSQDFLNSKVINW